VVLYRIKRLEDTHIIRGYFTDIDTAKMGYTTFRILLNLSNYSKEDEEELTKFLLSVPQLIWFFKTEGKYDMDIVYVSKSVTEFYSFIDQLHIRFNRLIADEKIGTLIQLLYYGKDYLINKKREKMPIKNFNSEVVDIDENDKKILISLSNNGKISIIDLAKITSLSINTVKDRMKRLEKNKIISGYRPFIDTEKSGYNYSKIFINLKNYNASDIMKIHSFFEMKNSTIFTTKYLNGDDLEVETHLENDKQLFHLKDELTTQFGKIIKEIYVLQFSKEYIFRYLPEKI
jgi:DNA-binding Lrp family transcriptional regulator